MTVEYGPGSVKSWLSTTLKDLPSRLALAVNPYHLTGMFEADLEVVQDFCVWIHEVGLSRGSLRQYNSRVWLTLAKSWQTQLSKTYRVD
jgi:hypothetical protein